MKGKNGKLELRLEDQVIAKYNRHIYFPLYMNSYEDALRSIFLRIVWIEDGRQEYEERFHQSPQERESNIISFIGARGSGKTTAMTEFCKILDDLNSESERQWWIERVFTEAPLKEWLMNRRFFFKVLEPIDASSLEEKEDLFEMVMGAIFREYKETAEKTRFAEDNLYANREILELFEEIIRGYYAIKNSREENFGDSYITRLSYMSTSMDINKKMKELIRRLLQAYQGDKSRGDIRGFLVVSLDDLDLNIRHGYEMLEQLRKYFFQENIIITLSGDYDQLNRICKYHYVKEFSEEKSHVIEESVQEDCRQLALDYILKTLPINARVFMPSLETMTKDVVVIMGEQSIGVKAFVMVKIAEKMQSFYDIRGLKVHFSEPRTVRELVNYNQFLESLWEIKYEQWNLDHFTTEEQMVWMNHYDQNHERFNQDILGRLVNRLLDDEHQRIFDEWAKMNLERRASEVCKILWEKIREKNGQQRVYDLGGYTYGELLEGIYRYGRLSDVDKQFVKCVLAFLSSEMVREKISSLKNPSEDSRMHSQIRLRKLLGVSFGNSWLGEMIPRMRDTPNPSNSKYFLKAGYHQKVEATKLVIQFPIIPEDVFSKFSGKRGRTRSKNIMRSKLKGFEKWLSDQKVIPALECLAMFYEPMKGQQENLQFNMRIGIDQSSVQKVQYMFARGINESCYLDIFGFIKKTLDYEEDYKKRCQGLATSFCNMLIEYTEQRDRKISDGMDKDMEMELREVVGEIVEELSIHHKYPWDNRQRAAFPFYDLDLSYNTLKRARSELLESNMASISQEEYYFYITKVYQKIIDLLEEQKRMYEKGLGVFDYADNFKNCPFVRAFLDEENVLPVSFKERLGTMIFNTFTPASLIGADHPEGEE